MGDNPVKNLWVRICSRISSQTNMDDVVDIYCKFPDQEEIDETFFKQLEKASCP